MEGWVLILALGFLLGALAIGLGHSEPPVRVVYIPQVEKERTSGPALWLFVLVLLALMALVLLNQAMG